MKKFATWVGVFCCITSSLQAQNKIMNTSIYQYVVSDINGDDFDFSSLKGKKIMVVNTASKCGLTPQYKELQALYDRFKDSGFVVIGFPSNNFFWQESGTNEDIVTFCEKNYGVSFPMMSKINVKGSKKHPVYQFLTQKKKNGLRDSSVSWNFQKYLIDEEGQLVDVVGPRTQPDDEKILNWIKS